MAKIPSDNSVYSTGLQDVLAHKTEILAYVLGSKKKKNRWYLEIDVKKLHPVTNLLL